MIGPYLHAHDSEMELVAPDIDRDAAYSVAWLNGSSGKATMILMGNAPESITETTLKAERERIGLFIT